MISEALRVFSGVVTWCALCSAVLAARTPVAPLLQAVGSGWSLHAGVRSTEGAAAPKCREMQAALQFAGCRVRQPG